MRPSRMHWTERTLKSLPCTPRRGLSKNADIASTRSLLVDVTEMVEVRTAGRRLDVEPSRSCAGVIATRTPALRANATSWAVSARC